MPQASDQTKQLSYFAATLAISLPKKTKLHQIAAAIFVSQQLGLQNGMLIAAPNPEPSDEHINTAIQACM
jgi:pseudouridine-5'-phosphate glycosidase